MLNTIRWREQEQTWSEESKILSLAFNDFQPANKTEEITNNISVKTQL